MIQHKKNSKGEKYSIKGKKVEKFSKYLNEKRKDTIIKTVNPTFWSRFRNIKKEACKYKSTIIKFGSKDLFLTLYKLFKIMKIRKIKNKCLHIIRLRRRPTPLRLKNRIIKALKKMLRNEFKKKLKKKFKSKVINDFKHKFKKKIKRKVKNKVKKKLKKILRSKKKKKLKKKKKSPNKIKLKKEKIGKKKKKLKSKKKKRKVIKKIALPPQKEIKTQQKDLGVKWQRKKKKKYPDSISWLVGLGNRKARQKNLRSHGVLQNKNRAGIHYGKRVYRVSRNNTRFIKSVVFKKRTEQLFYRKIASKFMKHGRFIGAYNKLNIVLDVLCTLFKYKMGKSFILKVIDKQDVKTTIPKLVMIKKGRHFRALQNKPIGRINVLVKCLVAGSRKRNLREKGGLAGGLLKELLLLITKQNNSSYINEFISKHLSSIEMVDEFALRVGDKFSRRMAFRREIATKRKRWLAELYNVT